MHVTFVYVREGSVRERGYTQQITVFMGGRRLTITSSMDVGVCISLEVDIVCNYHQDTSTSAIFVLKLDTVTRRKDFTIKDMGR